MVDVNKVHEHNGKLWVRSGSVQYTKRDGKQMTLDKWTSTCDKCDAPIYVLIPPGSVLWSKSFGRKHCDTHKLTKAQVQEKWLEGIKNGRK